MKLDFKVTARQHIVFNNKWMSASAVLAGVAFFFVIVNYLGIKNLLDVGFGEILFCFIMPMLLLGGYIVLLRVTHSNVTPVYGILGTLFCLYMLIQSFSYGNVFHIIVAVIWYLFAGVVCFGTTFGYIASNTVFLIACFVPIGFRLLFIDIKLLLSGAIFSLIPEVTSLCGLATFGLFAICLRPVAFQPERKRDK